ncbi:uncharacterized protein N0V89_009199 [Didymosphaeria variabile]|uniref:Inhibitor I9 domain-containing protein n=1 Tax=Didymosphaeria variabile TaxID=1932322 RepID=A0A9W8XEP2_9PLEO|nr:uncharacterized protein N0V89_009199 [Didymosphaeria variabile]KAJ4347829.1 hypothetical protein N0V89_009199 [Didymosphaeria variabile]
MAVAPALHDVIISFSKDAPSSLLEEAKEKVRNTEGAEITHEYTIIPAFAATVPEGMFPELQAMSTDYPPTIEGDGIMTTQDKDGGVQVGI